MGPKVAVLVAAGTPKVAIEPFSRATFASNALVWKPIRYVARLTGSTFARTWVTSVYRMTILCVEYWKHAPFFEWLEKRAVSRCRAVRRYFLVFILTVSASYSKSTFWKVAGATLAPNGILVEVTQRYVKRTIWHSVRVSRPSKKLPSQAFISRTHPSRNSTFYISVCWARSSQSVVIEYSRTARSIARLRAKSQA